MNTAFKIRRINVSLTWHIYDHDLTTGEALNTAEIRFGAPLKVKRRAFEFGQKLPPPRPRLARLKLLPLPVTFWQGNNLRRLLLYSDSHNDVPPWSSAVWNYYGRTTERRLSVLSLQQPSDSSSGNSGTSGFFQNKRSQLGPRVDDLRRPVTGLNHDVAAPPPPHSQVDAGESEASMMLQCCSPAPPPPPPPPPLNHTFTSTRWRIGEGVS